MSPSSIYRTQLVLLVLFFACAAIVWPHLPARIPMHFDLAGQPNRWVRTTWLAWFGLPLLAAAITLFIYGIDRLLLHSPELWNLPDKERFLRMSAADRMPIEAAVHRFVAWCTLLVTCSFIGAELEVYRSVQVSVAPGWIVQGLVWAPTILVLALALRMSHTIRAQIRRGGAAEEHART